MKIFGHRKNHPLASEFTADSEYTIGRIKERIEILTKREELYILLMCLAMVVVLVVILISSYFTLSSNNDINGSIVNLFYNLKQLPIIPLIIFPIILLFRLYKHNSDNSEAYLKMLTMLKNSNLKT